MRADDPYTVVARSLAEAAAARTGTPLLFGIAGSVAAGKSTTAGLLRRLLSDRGLTVRILTTDCFLLPTATLAERGLLMEKGFPHTYDTELMRATLDRLRSGEAATVPVYSHDSYDLVPGATDTIDAVDVVIVEGVNALQPPLVERLDLSLYLHTNETHVKEWFTDRFLALCREAEAGGAPFYRMFLEQDEAERRAAAGQVWDAINGRNLREHIAPSRWRATWVLTKAADHTVDRLEQRRTA